MDSSSAVQALVGAGLLAAGLHFHRHATALAPTGAPHGCHGSVPRPAAAATGDRAGACGSLPFYNLHTSRDRLALETALLIGFGSAAQRDSCSARYGHDNGMRRVFIAYAVLEVRSSPCRGQRVSKRYTLTESAHAPTCAEQVCTRASNF